MPEVALRLIGKIHRGVMPCIIYSMLVILSPDKNTAIVNQVYSSGTGKTNHLKQMHLVHKLVMVTSVLFLCFSFFLLSSGSLSMNRGKNKSPKDLILRNL